MSQEKSRELADRIDNALRAHGLSVNSEVYVLLTEVRDHLYGCREGVAVALGEMLYAADLPPTHEEPIPYIIATHPRDLLPAILTGFLANKGGEVTSVDAIGLVAFAYAAAAAMNKAEAES